MLFQVAVSDLWANNRCYSIWIDVKLFDYLLTHAKNRVLLLNKNIDKVLSKQNMKHSTVWRIRQSIHIKVIETGNRNGRFTHKNDDIHSYKLILWRLDPIQERKKNRKKIWLNVNIAENKMNHKLYMRYRSYELLIHVNVLQLLWWVSLMRESHKMLFLIKGIREGVIERFTFVQNDRKSLYRWVGKLDGIPVDWLQKRYSRSRL
jgi:hypothetical protein